MGRRANQTIFVGHATPPCLFREIDILVGSDERYLKIAQKLFKNIQKDEFLILNFDAEVSNFVRLNKAKIRQPGNVKQISMSLSLSNRDKRNLKSHVRLNGSSSKDLSTLIRTLNYLRRELPDLPKDPYLLFSKSVQSTEVSDEKNINDEENLDYIFQDRKLRSCRYILVGLHLHRSS